MPKLLKLQSLKVNDLQEGDSILTMDKVRLIVVLDGYPVKWIGFDLLKNMQYNFTHEDNLTDEELTEYQQEFIFWSLAEITAYEADPEGIDALGVDTDIDEWVQTIRLDHRSSSNGLLTIKIGKKNDEEYLSDGRSDTEWVLEYSLEDFEIKYDQSFFDLIVNTNSESEKLNESAETGNFEQDKRDCKWICSIDGGGLRGIFPLRLLEQLERYYNKSCFEMFDMFAGTSTGSIIAALLASGYTLKETIAFYTNYEIRKRIFRSNKRGQNHAFKFFDLRQLSGNANDITSLDEAVYANKFIDLIEFHQDDVESLANAVSEQLITPRYRKTGIKELLYQGFSKRSGNSLIPLKLNECDKDILITARDLHRNETTFFTAFHIPFESADPREDPAKPTFAASSVSSEKSETGIDLTIPTIVSSPVPASDPVINPPAAPLVSSPIPVFEEAVDPTTPPVVSSPVPISNEGDDSDEPNVATSPIPRPQPYPGKIIDVITGTYNDLYLKDVVEASASAPVYFSPRSQFSDGGIGAHNNPAFMAAVEALKFSNIDLNENTLEAKYTPYKEANGAKSGTVVWSFGTSYSVPNPDADADIPRLIGGSQALRKRNDTVIYWISQIIDSLMFGANQEQDYLCRELLKDQIKYLRFNLGVNNSTLNLLNIDGDRNQIKNSIKLDSIEEDEFSIMDSVAKQFALYVRDADFGFNNGGYEIKGQDDVEISTYKTTVMQNFNEYQ